MQSVMVGLCTEKHTARTAPRWQLMSQSFVSSAFCLMHAKLHSHTVSAIVYVFNAILPTPLPMHCNAVSPPKVLERVECIWYSYSCFSSSSLLSFFFFSGT